MAYTRLVFTFVESSVFERLRPTYLDDDEYSELQQYMVQNPESGEIVPGSGGVRKLGWRRRGMGQRGGLRIIHFLRYEPNVRISAMVTARFRIIVTDNSKCSEAH